MKVPIIWLVAVVSIWVLAWRFTRGWQSLGLRITRGLIRTLVIALAVAPTVIVAGYVVIPLPATLTVFSYAVEGHWAERPIQQEVHRAVVFFVIFWALAFSIATIRILWVYDRRQKDVS
jgi:hypothetical protein